MSEGTVRETPKLEGHHWPPTLVIGAVAPPFSIRSLGQEAISLLTFAQQRPTDYPRQTPLRYT